MRKTASVTQDILGIIHIVPNASQDGSKQVLGLNLVSSVYPAHIPIVQACFVRCVPFSRLLLLQVVLNRTVNVDQVILKI